MRTLWHISSNVTALLLVLNPILSEAQSFCTNCDDCPTYSTRSNPDLRTSCESEIRLTLVIDESKSIADAGSAAIAAVREGVLAFLQDLECTPVKVAVVEFSTNARYVISNHIPVQQARNCMINYFDGRGCGGQSYRPDGATNWQAALILAEKIPSSDMMIFFTDGVPTAWTPDPNNPTTSNNVCSDGTTTEPVELYNAVQIANEIKRNGTKIFALGVGNVNQTQLRAVSGNTRFETNGSLADSDYTLVSNFSGLKAAWSSLSQNLCPLMLSCVATQHFEEGNIVTIDLADDAKAPFNIEYGGQSIVSNTEPIIIKGLGGGDYTFAVSDASTCHRDMSCTVRVPVFEDEEPIMTNCPDDILLDCVDEGTTPNVGMLPAPMNAFQLGASDDRTATADLIVSHEDTGPIVEGCAHVFVRTYTVTDRGGQEATCSHRLEVEFDPEGPEFIGIPRDLRVSCADGMPEWPEVRAIDGCAGEVSFQHDQEVQQLSCGYNIIRTYTAVDPCGNTSKKSYKLEVRDEAGPVFSNIPEDGVVSCTLDPIPWPFVTAIDDCTGAVEIERSEQVIDLECGRDIIRTFTAIDLCGNETVRSYTVQVRDLTAPTLTVPDDVTLGCGDPLPSSSDIMVSDDCSDPDIQFTEERIERSLCEYDLVRTWTATDLCGNETTKTQVITLEDRQAPVITPVIPMLQGVETTGVVKHFGCELPTMAVSDISVTDDCCQMVLDIVMEESTKGLGVCNVFDYTKHFECSYIATDASGKVTRLEFDLLIYDTMAPQLNMMPTSRSIGCNEALPEAPAISIVDGCQVSEHSLTFTEQLVFNPRRAEQSAVVREWIAQDECGNSTEAQQIIGQCGLDYRLVSGEIVSQVWLDENEDGVKAVGEKGINGVTVILYYLDEASGKTFVADSALTAKIEGKDGMVNFGPLLPGQYRMQYLPGGDLLATKYHASASASDSDVLPDLMMTDFFDLDVDQKIVNISAGFYEGGDVVEEEEKPTGFTGVIETRPRSGYEPGIEITVQAASFQRGKVNTSQLHVFPNPVQGQLSFQFSHDQEERIEAMIIDQWGRPMRRLMIQSIEGTQVGTINVHGLPAGIYSLLMSKDNGPQQARFVKI